MSPIEFFFSFSMEYSKLIEKHIIFIWSEKLLRTTMFEAYRTSSVWPSTQEVNGYLVRVLKSVSSTLRPLEKQIESYD